MIIKYLDDLKLISIEGVELNDFITNIIDYTGVTISANNTCLTTNILQTYNTTEVIDNTSNFYILDNILYVKPDLFGLTNFTDDIYKFDIKLNTSTGYTLISNCFFLDITYKCKVATLLKNIIEENKTKDSEKLSTIAHLLHYSLVNGSNCGCNCAEMCEVFKALKDLLVQVDPTITNDCGC